MLCFVQSTIKFVPSAGQFVQYPGLYPLFMRENYTSNKKCELKLPFVRPDMFCPDPPGPTGPIFCSPASPPPSPFPLPTHHAKSLLGWLPWPTFTLFMQKFCLSIPPFPPAITPSSKNKTCHMSHVTCHMSCVTCHLSSVRCHMSHVTYHIFFIFFYGQSGEA